MRIIQFSSLTIAMLLGTSAANAVEREYKGNPDHAVCVDEAQTRYGLDPDLLQACMDRKAAQKRVNKPSPPPPPRVETQKPAEPSGPSLSERRQMTETMQSKAEKDKNLDPWSKKSPATAKSGRAPFASRECAKFNQRSTGAVDWDYVTITNTCSVPIQVIMCYHTAGQDGVCKTKTWGTSDTIQPGKSTTSVADVRSHPFQVKHMVCDMSGIKNHEKSCLKP